MKLHSTPPAREQGSAMIAYLVIVLVVVAMIASLSGLVIQNVQFGSRRQDMINAYQYAQGGAAIACQDVQTAFTNGGTSFISSLESSVAAPYTKDTAQSSGSTWVYQRSINAPFTNQTVSAQLSMPGSSNPSKIKVISSAAVGQVSQTVEVNLEMKFGAGAAIISTAKGTASTSASKSAAQAGNAVVTGNKSGTTLINGGILANGRANTNLCSVDYVSQQKYGTSSQIPDFTSPGSVYQLFDFNRFIAAADLNGTHFTNITEFFTEANKGVLEGVIVVDLPKGAKTPSITPTLVPNGINVRGTLVFNFIGAWDPLDKIVNTATININAANLTNVTFSNPATHTTGYPPVYSDTSKNPTNLNLTSKGFDNFLPNDDLPALMYNNAILDIHGDANICGVVYSPSFMEIENKEAGQVQYFRGTLIGGGGVFVENNKVATSVVSYDANALDQLATYAMRGKALKVAYTK